MFRLKTCFIVALIFVIKTSAQEKISFEDASLKTEEIGVKYINAYFSMDWDKLELMLADCSTFADPTAAYVFGGIIRNGKQEMMKNFRENYTSIELMKFKKARSFFSGDYAIFEGDLDWTIVLQGNKRVRSIMPIITMLKVQNNKIIEHRDYADYHPFLKEYKKVDSKK